MNNQNGPSIHIDDIITPQEVSVTFTPEQQEQVHRTVHSAVSVRGVLAVLQQEDGSRRITLCVPPYTSQELHSLYEAFGDVDVIG